MAAVVLADRFLRVVAPIHRDSTNHMSDGLETLVVMCFGMQLRE